MSKVARLESPIPKQLAWRESWNHIKERIHSEGNTRMSSKVSQSNHSGLKVKCRCPKMQALEFKGEGGPNRVKNPQGARARETTLDALVPKI